MTKLESILLVAKIVFWAKTLLFLLAFAALVKYLLF